MKQECIKSNNQCDYCENSLYCVERHNKLEERMKMIWKDSRGSSRAKEIFLENNKIDADVKLSEGEPPQKEELSVSNPFLGDPAFLAAKNYDDAMYAADKAWEKLMASNKSRIKTIEKANADHKVIYNEYLDALDSLKTKSLEKEGCDGMFDFSETEEWYEDEEEARQ